MRCGDWQYVRSKYAEIARGTRELLERLTHGATEGQREAVKAEVVAFVTGYGIDDDNIEIREDAVIFWPAGHPGRHTERDDGTNRD